MPEAHLNQPQSDAVVSKTRVDAPHPITGADDAASPDEPNDDSLPVDFATYGEQSSDQILIQAGQLAAHLRSRQRDLDRREAQLNSRSAQLDKDRCASRLWIQEREQEFKQREGQIRQQIAEFEERATALSVAEIADDDASDQPEPNKRTILRFDEVEDPLGSAGQALLKAERKQLTIERRKLDQKTRDKESALTLKLKQAEAEIERKRKQLNKQSANLDKRTAALEQLQNEVSRIHRDALELRVVTEQIWSQLSKGAVPAKLIQSLSQSRAKLSEHYRLENDKLHQQCEDLKQLSAKLSIRRNEIARQRDQLEQWFSRRQQDIEEQATRLIARERELDQQEQRYEASHQQWDDERRHLERQIRDLSEQVASRELVSV